MWYTAYGPSSGLKRASINVVPYESRNGSNGWYVKSFVTEGEARDYYKSQVKVHEDKLLQFIANMTPSVTKRFSDNNLRRFLELQAHAKELLNGNGS